MSYGRYKKQSELSQDEINDKIKGFTKMAKINELRKGMLVRYYAKDRETGKMNFRMGGILTFIHEKDGYLRLKNTVTNTSWSVQLNTSIIYYKDVQQSRKETHNIGDRISKLLDKFDKENSLDNKINFIEDLINVMGNNPNSVDRNIDRIYNEFDGSITVLFEEYDKIKKKYKKLK